MSAAATSSESITTPQKKLDTDGIVSSWSPREARAAGDSGKGGTMKVRSLQGNTRLLRGGDWIFSRDALVTLSVAWYEHRDKKYGLTAAHAFTDHGMGEGSSVFAFDSDDKTIKKPDGSFAHKTIKIGTVLSVDMETDSIVFEIFPYIGIDPLAIALSPDQICKVKLPTPFETNRRLPYGRKLVMYGAARRGMIGVTVEKQMSSSAAREIATASFVASAGGKDVVTSGTKLTFHGDCGGLYIDDDSVAWCMHTSIYGVKNESDNKTEWVSHGASLQKVVNNHSFYFGHSPQLAQSSSSLSSTTTGNQSPVGSSSVISTIMFTELSVSAGADAEQRQYPKIYIPPNGTVVESGFQRGLSFSRLPVQFPDTSDDDNDDGDEDENQLILSRSSSSYICARL